MTLDMVMVDTEASDPSPSKISMACGKCMANSAGMLRYQWPEAAIELSLCWEKNNHLY